jgi:hypothetical protein
MGFLRKVHRSMKGGPGGAVGGALLGWPVARSIGKVLFPPDEPGLSAEERQRRLQLQESMQRGQENILRKRRLRESGVLGGYQDVGESFLETGL